MKRAAALACFVFLAGCQGGGFGGEPDGTALMAALKQNPEWQVSETPNLPAVVAIRRSASAQPVWVYIEGDGHAWTSRTVISDDPTPQDPVALRMALTPTDTSVIYLGRPCQYVKASLAACDLKWWTMARYAPEVVESLDRALTTALREMPAARIMLVGYSGGGPLAALLAARRKDVDGLITVAANLDLEAWTQLHNLTPLTGSMDPAQHASEIGHIPQVHFTGQRDSVVPSSVTRAFLARLPAGADAHMIEEPAFDHHCCWALHWEHLRREAVYTLRGSSGGSSSHD